MRWSFHTQEMTSAPRGRVGSGGQKHCSRESALSGHLWLEIAVRTQNTGIFGRQAALRVPLPASCLQDCSPKLARLPSSGWGLEVSSL